MDDKEFLLYVDFHSSTELALFHTEQVYRLCDLAGSPRPECLSKDGWYSLHEEAAAPLVKRARDRLNGQATAGMAGLYIEKRRL